jgi:hypothetical protein
MLNHKNIDTLLQIFHKKKTKTEEFPISLQSKQMEQLIFLFIQQHGQGIGFPVSRR